MIVLQNITFESRYMMNICSYKQNLSTKLDFQNFDSCLFHNKTTCPGNGRAPAQHYPMGTEFTKLSTNQRGRCFSQIPPCLIEFSLLRKTKAGAYTSCYWGLDPEKEPIKSRLNACYFRHTGLEGTCRRWRILCPTGSQVDNKYEPPEVQSSRQ